MKKILSLSIALIFAASMATPVLAEYRPFHKLRDGTVGILSSPAELGHHMAADTKSAEFAPVGLFTGTLKGAAHMLKKAVDGAVDVVTSPIPMD